ncbi:MAG TPA: transposase, partial [Acidimicrobiia bacterium]|nr:transposase [Acidimicrobiia bacterium]
MIEVRRRIQRIAPQGSRPAFEPAIFRSRYLQLPRLDHLSDDRIEALGRVLADRPELEAAWRSSTSTASTSPKTQTRPTRRLGRSSTFGTTHPLVEFDRLVETLLEWGDEIFACHDTDRITNGRIEGTNNRLGVLKRVA